MNAMNFGLMVSALALVAIAGNASANAIEIQDGLVEQDSFVDSSSSIKVVSGSTGTSCVGWGGSNGVCWGIYLGGGTQTCTGIWSGNRCLGLQT